MLWDHVRSRGWVTVTLFDRNGEIKRRPPGFLRRLLGRPGRPEIRRHHNIITTQGDNLLADRISGTDSLSPVDDVNGHIEVGTGWTNVSPKSNTGCNTASGNRQALDEGYPQLKDGASNVVVYRATFPVGDLDVNGLDEAALMNGDAAGECLAYAQITPAVNITEYDTLQIEWEITFLGT